MKVLWSTAGLVMCLAATAVFPGGELASAATTGVAAEHLGSVVGTVSSCTIEPTEDSLVYELSPDTNYATLTTIRTASRTNRIMRAFLTFTASSCPGLTSSSIVLSAQLRMYINGAPTVNRDHDLKRVDASWVESTITWNNQPAVSNTVTDSIGIRTTSGVYVTYNGTSDVEAWVAGELPNYGWRISDNGEGTSTQYQTRYRSRDHSNTAQQPKLTILHM